VLVPARSSLSLEIHGAHACSLAFAGSAGAGRCRSTSSLRRCAIDPRIAPPGAGLVELSAAEPQVPLLQLAVVFLSTSLPFAYWWYIVVPLRRRELSASKKRGDVREYLEELAAEPEGSRKGEKWLYDKYLREAKLTSTPREAGLPEAVGALEDGLQEALPGGGFWSFDNPVFVYLVLFAAFCVVQLVSRALNG